MSDENPYSSPQALEGELRPLGYAKSIVLIAGAFLGGLALDMVNSMFVLPFWIQLGFRRPVQDWLISIGLGSLAGYYGMVWIQITDWLLAALYGIVIGILFPRRWLLASFCGGISFAYATFFLLSSPFSLATQFGLSAFVFVLAWKVPSVLLVVGTAYLASRTIRERQHRVRGGGRSSPSAGSGPDSGEA